MKYYENMQHAIYHIFKIATDKILSIVLIVLSLPVLFMISAILLIMNKRILFLHPRIGKSGKVFYCLKFATMLHNSEQLLENFLSANPQAKLEWQQTFKLEYDPRINKFGSFLRKSSLDELPQLINVLIGNMSLVGPRPITADEISFYGEHYTLYTSVLPGITGAWQVSGVRDYISRVKIDVHYIKNLSIARDMLILIKTIRVVLFMKNR